MFFGQIRLLARMKPDAEIPAIRQSAVFTYAGDFIYVSSDGGIAETDQIHNGYENVCKVFNLTEDPCFYRTVRWNTEVYT